MLLLKRLRRYRTAKQITLGHFHARFLKPDVLRLGLNALSNNIQIETAGHMDY